MCRFIFLSVYGIVKYLPTPFGDLLRFCVLKCFLGQLQTIWIHEGATFHHPHLIKIGKRTSINENVFINGFGGVVIGDDVAIGAGVTLFSADHQFSDLSRPIAKQPIDQMPISIENDVYIGINAIILGGVSIGTGAVIGAGAVVTHAVPEKAVVAGVPATILRYRK